MLKVLVCGGRTYNDAQLVNFELAKLRPDIVMQGGATGADALARIWALACCKGSWTFPADWERLGPSAGPIRNQFMLEHGKPDLVLAFPGGKGTADMVKRAKKAGVKVQMVSDDELDRTGPL